MSARWEELPVECPECRGSGMSMFMLPQERTCSACNGRGETWKTVRVELEEAS